VTGSLALELGEDDAPLPLAEDDPLIAGAIAAIRAELERRLTLVPAEPAPSTLRLAEELKRDFEPRV
jgi:hypothetical protein